MEASHNLPHDIVRLLLEFSASTSLETARTLSLVSKEVQRWADTHLFQVVQGTVDPDYSEVSGILLEMIMFDASPRLILARHHVRAVAWRERVWTATSLRQVLDNFPNISQLCLWNNLFPFDPEQLGPGELSEITQHYPALKRVATSLSARLYLPQSAFRSPFWMTITHLQVNYYMNGFSSKLSPFELPLFTSMSSLSHLALLDMDIFGEDDLDLAFSRVKQTFPPLLFMCLLALMPRFKRRDHWFADSKVISMSRKVDERIVMVPSPDEDNSDDIVVVQCKDNFPEWCAIQDGAQTLWEKGETVLKRWRERLAAV